MDKTLRKNLPLLLRPYEILTQEEIASIYEAYQAMGREKVDEELRREKQTRPYASLVLANIDCDSDYWEQVHTEYVNRNTCILDFVKKVSRDFAAKGGKTMSVYENYGAVLSSGISIGCFASGDVDFTVNEDELEIAKSALVQNGFILDTRKDHAAVSQKLVMSFYNPDALRSGYWLNIMRKPIARDFMLKQNLYLKRLIELRAHDLERYGDTDVQLLPPTAMVYYNALHFACEHHYSASPGMSLCCDIDRVARNCDVDWQLLKKWAIEDKVGIRLQLALDICRYFLKTPVPENLWDRKSSNYKKLWSRLVDEKNGFLISQDGRLSRLYTELISDDKPVLFSLVLRLWSK